jgi:hypothetical protein
MAKITITLPDDDAKALQWRAIELAHERREPLTTSGLAAEYVLAGLHAGAPADHPTVTPAYQRTSAPSHQQAVTPADQPAGHAPLRGSATTRADVAPPQRIPSDPRPPLPPQTGLDQALAAEDPIQRAYVRTRQWRIANGCDPDTGEPLPATRAPVEVQQGTALDPGLMPEQSHAFDGDGDAG